MIGKTMKNNSGVVSTVFNVLFAMAGLAALSGSAQAMEWCGENGTIRFSFVEGQSNANIHHVKAEDGVTKVTLVAWMTDVDPVSINGRAFDGLGGFELKLKIDGAKGYILEHLVMEKGLNLSTENGAFRVGMAFGLDFVDGKAPLASWDIMFQGDVEDVKFSLDPTGVVSCPGSPNCPDADLLAIYIGTDISKQLQDLFSAGYEPAWLNPSTSDPDMTIVTGGESWEKVGRCLKFEED